MVSLCGEYVSRVTLQFLCVSVCFSKDILVIYRISYVWYSMIGCVSVVVVGLIVSLLTGYTRPSKVNPRTIHPIYNFLCGVMLPSSLHNKFMVKSAGEYDVEHMIELGRSKNAYAGGKDNPGFASSDEKPRINGLVASADSSKATVNGSIVHRRSTPGIVASNPEMIAFRPITSEHAPRTETEVPNTYSSDASARTCAKSAPPALDRQAAGAPATSSAEDVRKRVNADSAGLSSVKGESDDHDKTQMTTSKEHRSADSPPSHSVHRSRRSGSSRREKHHRTRHHSSSPHSRRRPSSPKREPARDESATEF